MKAKTKIVGGFISIFAIAIGYIAWRNHLRIFKFHIDFGDSKHAMKQNLDIQSQNQRLRDQISQMKDMQTRTTHRDRESSPLTDGAHKGSGYALIEITPNRINQVVAHRYGRFLEHTMLNNEQTNRLRELLGKRQEAALDAINASLQIGLVPAVDIDQIRDAISESQNEFNTEIVGEFGASLYSQLQEYENSAPARNTVGNLTSILNSTSTPLTADQKAALVPIITQTQAPDNGSASIGRVAFGGMDYHARITSDTINAAASVLSPSQLQAMQDLLKQQTPSQLQPWESR